MVSRPKVVSLAVQTKNVVITRNCRVETFKNTYQYMFCFFVMKQKQNFAASYSVANRTLDQREIFTLKSSTVVPTFATFDE